VYFWRLAKRSRCTWESKQNILDHQIITAWQSRQSLATKGWRDPFDVTAWEKRQAEILETKHRRYARRKEKRRAKGLPRVHPLEEGTDSSSGDDQLFVHSAARRRAKANIENSSDGVAVHDNDSEESEVVSTSSPRRRRSIPRPISPRKAQNALVPYNLESTSTRNTKSTEDPRGQSLDVVSPVPIPSAMRPSVATATISNMTGIHKAFSSCLTFANNPKLRRLNLALM
jgi:hypothetical protein